MLAKRFHWTPRFEPVDNNPYLDDFYADMPRWSFNLQVYFLNKRFKEVVEIAKSKETIIQDRTIFEDARIFAPNLHAMGMMSDRDFANYSDLFDLMISLVELPDLMIYANAFLDLHPLKHPYFGQSYWEARPRIREKHSHRLSHWAQQSL